MILEGLFTLLVAALTGFFSAVPDVSWSCDSLVYQNAVSLIQGICYLMPSGAVVAITSFVFSLMAFRVLVAVLKTIKGMIPFI